MNIIKINYNWSNAILFDQKGGNRELGKELCRSIEAEIRCGTKRDRSYKFRTREL